MTICAKLFSNRPSSFCVSFWSPWQPEFFMEWKSFHKFERGPPRVIIPVKLGEISPSHLGDVI